MYIEKLKQNKMKKAKLNQKVGYLTAKEFGRKFRTNSKVIKETINKYEIGKGTELVDKTTEDWLIHESLHSDLAFHLLPDVDLGPRGRVSFGGKKPGIDSYDGNFS